MRAKAKTMRGIRWAVGLLFASAGAGFGLHYFDLHGDPPLQYRTFRATRAPLTQVVTATGQLNPVVNVQVGSQISGIIQHLFVDYNSVVKSNQVIAQIDPATYRANVREAEGNVADAKANLELMRLNANRSQELRKNELIPQADTDQALANLHQAEATLMIREAALENAKVDLSRTTIYSPIDGVVISRNVDVGQTVAASLSAPTLFVIAHDLAQMQIAANVSEADVGAIHLGQEAEFTVDAFPYQVFKGEVVQIRNAPVTVENVVTYDTVVAVDNPELKLKPGMTANVSIIVARHPNALVIPNAALRFRPLDADESGMAGAQSFRHRTGFADNQPTRNSHVDRRGTHSSDAQPVPATWQIAPERSPDHTVYLLAASNGGKQVSARDAKLRPLTIKTGISDGIYTEVLGGLKPDQAVVVGLDVPLTASAQRATVNPFGGRFRRF